MTLSRSRNTGDEMIDIPHYLHLLTTATLFSAALLFAGSLLLIFFSSLDDCFGDLLWVSLRLTATAAPPLPEKEVEEGLLAVLLPAWQEAAVLPQSLTHLLTNARYRNFRVFVGIYPNDQATERAVRRLAKEDARIIPIITPRPGPTCKADCLNALLRGALAWEEVERRKFKGFILQDAEDMTHPEALSCFNRALDYHDLIQLPVVPVVRRWSACIGGHYMDEFAEMHGKDVPVRALVTGVVPGSGVATAYARQLLVTASDRAEGAFNTDTLTEDYELSFRLAGTARRQIFLRLTGSQADTLATRYDIIATRELFPHSLRAAVRQKARWIVGISCQGWRQLGWRGSLMSRYYFLRDRKILLCGHANLISAVGLLYSLGQRLTAELAPAHTPPPLLADDDLLWHVAFLNIGFLLHRLLVRHLCVWSLYGWRQLPLVLPRYLAGILVNYLALCRASRIFGSHLLTGKPIGWDKTSHDFPAAIRRQPAKGIMRPAYGGAT
ncbi:MAG TPA: glycosyltransferase [Kiloniellales bacterium]|nr:glycosyltransferase [Kiloniellales bacterium]